MGEQEGAALRRAEEAERELDRTKHREQELEKRLLSAKDAETHFIAEIKDLRADRDNFRKAIEEEDAKRQSRAKAQARRDKRGVGTRLAASSGPWTRSASAGAARR